MIDGNLALRIITETKPTISNIQELTDIEWTFEQHTAIVRALTRHGCQYLKCRDEYTLLKEVVSTDVTQVANSGKTVTHENAVISRAEGSGVNSPLCGAIGLNDTDTNSYTKPFMAPLDIQKAGSIADVILSFKVIQSNSMSLNISFDTEFQDYRDGSDKNRRVLYSHLDSTYNKVFLTSFTFKKSIHGKRNPNQSVEVTVNCYLLTD